MSQGPASEQVYDVISWLGKRYVKFTGSIEAIRKWAENIGYEVLGDESEYELKTADGRIDYLVLPQHEDYHDEWPRDEAVELATWM